MYRFYALLLLTWVLPLAAQAQAQHACGTDHSSDGRAAMKDRLLANIRIAAANAGAARTTMYVPIKFHVGAKNDGTERISESNLLDMLCELNEDFAPYDFQFFLSGGTFNYINNNTFYESHLETVNSIMTAQYDSLAVNVFIVDDFQPSGGLFGAYYNVPRDWIVIAKSQIGKDNNTLTHEMGHYFSLLHTYNGWDTPYIVENVPAPATTPLGIPTELQNHSNCDIAGDYICDTSPDYYFGTFWTECDWTLNVLDPIGERVMPDERNHMGSFRYCPDEEYFFSDMQAAAMLADYNAPARNYLRASAIPGFNEIMEQATPVAPVGNQVTPYYDSVLLEWNEVPNADAYFLEVSRVATFSVDPVRYIVYGNSQIVTGLLANKIYHWRVRPYSAHAACAPFSDVATFVTGDLVNTDAPDFVEAFSVFPNPVAGRNSLTVRLQTRESFSATLHFLDVAGRSTGISRAVEITASEQQIEMSILQLPTGVYFLQMTTASGRLSQKVIITQ